MEQFDPDSLSNQAIDGGSQQGEQDNMEEGIKPITRKEVNLPSREEVRKHMATHIPFRSWCEHCVKGKSGGNRHLRRKVEESSEIAPVVSMDYMYMSDNQLEGEERGMPIVVVIP